MATREIWQNGQLVGTEDLPDPEPAPPTAEERIAELEAIIAALLGVTP